MQPKRLPKPQPCAEFRRKDNHDLHDISTTGLDSLPVRRWHVGVDVDGSTMKQQAPQATQTAQERLETLADLLMAQDDLRGHQERGKALVEASAALQVYLEKQPAAIPETR
jgi:hypothetical protein